jgi:hypothetical protein
MPFKTIQREIEIVEAKTALEQRQSPKENLSR